jgi:transcription antitermination protein NusB
MVGPEQPDDNITCAVDQRDVPFEYSTLSRREQRGLILHMLYAMDSFDYQTSLTSLVDGFNRGFDLNIPLDGEAVTTAQAVIDARVQLDEEVLPFLANWRLERIGLFTKLILRFAVWELKQQQTPAMIVINEAIELAKCFAEHEAYRFVNGILDEYSKAFGPSMRGKKESA